jgi:hypothetical protein
MCFTDAMELVKRRRPEARPIPAFIPMLEAYEKEVLSQNTSGGAPKKKRKVVAGPSRIGPSLGPAVPGPPKKKMVPSIGASSIGPAIGPSMGPSIGPSIGPSTGPTIGPAIGPSIGPTRRPIGPSLPPTSSTTTKNDPSLDSKEPSSTTIGPSVGPSPRNRMTTPTDTTTLIAQEKDITEKTAGEPQLERSSKVESSSAGTIGCQLPGGASISSM